ncbi:nuclear transport factor 2 family protein, partial [Vibrio parahaemolyticus]|nr:nuclear transport factor 2 family protein [Vibrio parahaemolyticus]
FVYVDPDFPSRDFERISVLSGESNVRQTVQA